MKYCTHCGAQIDDEAVVCPKCGCTTAKGEEVFEENKNNSSNNNATLGLVAKIFMILTCVGCVVTAFASLGMYSGVENGLALGIGGLIGGLIPLCWVIPMTIKINNSLKNNEPLTTGFKVCTLIFANVISGILLLCMKEDN